MGQGQGSRIGQVLRQWETFTIPEYQRNYSWTNDELEDFWRDLTTVVESDNDQPHFFGTLLFREEDDDAVEVIDGQQRITTTIIFLNELRKFLPDDSESAAKIESRLIHNVSGIKLQLSDDKDNETLRDYIIGDDATAPRQDLSEQTGYARANTPAQNKLLNASDFFRDKIAAVDDPEQLFEELARFKVLEYGVDSWEQAVQIFETANDRGRDLTRLEKTKSFLMYRSHFAAPDRADNIIKNIQTKFGRMYELIEEMEGDSHWEQLGEDDIQRFHYILWDTKWTNSNDKKYYQNLLDHLKQRIRSGEAGINEIENYAKTLKEAFEAQETLVKKHSAAGDSENDPWYLIERMELVGRVGNFRPILMALFLKQQDGDISAAEYREVLDLIETLMVRTYVIQQKPAYTARSKIYTAARDFYQDNIDAAELKDKLRGIIDRYSDDQSVRESLERKEFYEDYSSNKTELRYLLYFYESYVQEHSDGDKMPLDLEDFVNGQMQTFDGSSIKIDVEHIHPKTPKNDEDDLPDHKHKIGNLTILPKGENSALQNVLQGEKTGTYDEINLVMNRDLVDDLDAWNADSIEDRTEDIADAFLDIWSYK